MEKKKILVTIPMTEEIQKDFEKAVEGGKYDCEFHYHYSGRVVPEKVRREGLSETQEEIAYDYQVIVGDVLPAYISKCTQVEYYQMNSAGYEAFMKPGVLPEKCILSNAVGVYGTIVSEHLIELMFDVMRKGGLYHRNQRAHIWKNEGEIKVVEGSTCVLFGVGNIGGAFARKMKALGAYVIGIRRNVSEKPDYLDEQYTTDEISSVIERADILALAMPGGEATYHIISEDVLRKMKSDSVIVNIGRGSLIDEKALVRCLNEGKFFGVGLDVTETEPLPEDSPLWDNERVFITPHVAGTWSYETIQKAVSLAKNNLYAWTHDKPMQNVVTEKRKK